MRLDDAMRAAGPASGNRQDTCCYFHSVKDSQPCPPPTSEGSATFTTQEGDQGEVAAQPKAVRDTEITPSDNTTDATKSEATPLWKTLVVGVVGALIGAAATLGGQWLTANWTDTRSQNEFVHSTKLDLYRRIAAAFSDANSRTVYFTSIYQLPHGTVPAKNIPIESYDLEQYKVFCKDISEEERRALRLVAADAIITATPAVIKLTQDAALQYELTFNSCHWILADGNRSAIPPMKSFADSIQYDYNNFITTARNEFGFDKLCTPNSERYALIRYLHLDC